MPNYGGFSDGGRRNWLGVDMGQACRLACTAYRRSGLVWLQPRPRYLREGGAIYGLGSGAPAAAP